MKLANVDRLPGWHLAHLARRFEGMALEPIPGASDADRTRWGEIASALRAHPNYPRG